MEERNAKLAFRSYPGYILLTLLIANIDIHQIEAVWNCGIDN